MQNKPRLDAVSGGLHGRKGRATVRVRSDRPVARGVLLPVDGGRGPNPSEPSSSLRRAKDPSPDLIARLEAGARDYAAKHGAALAEMQKRSSVAAGFVGWDAPLSAYGDYWSEASCKARLDRIVA